MKQFILAALLLAGCAALNTSPAPKPVEILTPSAIPERATEASEPVETVRLTLPVQPVITPVKVKVPVAKATRFVLESPQTYSAYIPRVEKFFQLALTDSTVLNKSKFDFSNATPDSLRESIRKGFEVTVKLYKPSIWIGGKWSSVIGYHSDGTIYLNEHYVNRSDCSVINTLVHESSHRMGYSHGNNSSEGKDNSVPYWIGDRAEELCKEGKI